MKSVFPTLVGASLLVVAATILHSIPNDPVPGTATLIDTTDSIPVNSLGGKNNVYQRPPSKADFTKGREFGKTGSGLRISYDKRAEGGFCGFYSIVHKGLEDYLDASAHKYITFWVRGETGEEKFKIGVADRQWAKLEDSLKSKEIGSYLPSGKITKEWQLAVIPMDDLLIDWKELHAIAVCFEADVFPDGSGQGAVHIDEIALTPELPSVQ
jgi:hypothetical protein